MVVDAVKVVPAIKAVNTGDMVDPPRNRWLSREKLLPREKWL